MSNNIGYLYNKGSFKKLREIKSSKDYILKKHIEDINKEILGVKITKWDYLRLDDDKDKDKDRAKSKDNGITRFKRATVYPGLLIGSGYNHDVNFDELGKSFDGSKEASFKIGFSFDHISGMPFIPGSSIKGMLRSFFPNEYKKDRGIENFTEDQECKKEYISDLLNAVRESNEEEKEFTKEDIDEIEEVIFSGVNKDGSRVEPYKRDIFFDAIPLCIEDNQESNPKTLFGSDYITPHVDKNGDPAPLKNPVPIKFLKVNPNVVYQFSFRFSDSMLSNGVKLSKDKKTKLFKKILSQSGLGAQTSVGYGQFDDTAKKKEEKEKEQQKMEEKIKDQKLAEDNRRHKEELKDNAQKKEETRLKIEAEQKEQKEKDKQKEEHRGQVTRERKHREAQEQGLSEIIQIKDIEVVIKRLEPWAKAYYANPKAKKELKGKVIPKELHQKFEAHIQSIFNENIDNGRFRKQWDKKYLRQLKDFDSDLNIMEE